MQETRNGLSHRDLSNILLCSELVRQFYRNEHSQLQPLKISSTQMFILHYLGSHEGCNQQTLADLRDVRRSTISDILSQMEKKQLVLRTRNAKDKRMTDVRLTPRGAVASQYLQEAFRDYCQEALDILNARETEQFLLYLERIAKKQVL